MHTQQEQLKIAVCGHIDHGKSTLIGRLLLDTKSLSNDKIKELETIGKTFGEETKLAHLSDQLKEERDRDITIETTQIFFKTRKRPYCLIDTPGHLEFIRNMLSGTSQARAALLLIDIREGIAEQTRRHAYLLKLLAIPSIIALVNKMDLVNYSQKDFDMTKLNLLSLFSELKIDATHIIPVSAKNAENISRASKKMAWFKGPCLIHALDSLVTTKNKALKTSLRFPVQDIYNTSTENIIVGQIACGTLKQGQKILVLPQNLETSIKSIRVFNKNKSSAGEGESIGLILADPSTVRRGNIICEANPSTKKTKSFQGNIFWLSSKELAKDQIVTLQCATQKFSCQVDRIAETMNPAELRTVRHDAKYLKQNETGLINFKPLSEVVLEEYSLIPQLGRYTIENSDEFCGAGTVLSVEKNSSNDF